MRLESRVMPRNSITLDGPMVFSSESGTPNSLNVRLRAEMEKSVFVKGKFTKKKSSKRWRTKGNLLLRRIQHKASDKVSNIFGLLRHPKVSRIFFFFLSTERRTEAIGKGAMALL